MANTKNTKQRVDVVRKSTTRKSSVVKKTPKTAPKRSRGKRIIEDIKPAVRKIFILDMSEKDPFVPVHFSNSIKVRFNDIVEPDDDITPDPLEDFAEEEVVKEIEATEKATPPSNRVDNQEKDKKNKKAKKPKKKWSKKKKFIVFFLLFLLIAILGIGGFFYLKLSNTASQIFEGSFFDVFVKKDPLKEDKYGRSNILIFGTSEDDEGHDGAELADSIMILSVNQHTNEANMISIPRDLWVSYDEPCSVGYSGKVNAVYYCAKENGKDDKAASLEFTKKASEIIGTDIQYFAAVNYTVVRDLVDALDGIDVDIYSADERGIYDVVTKLDLPAGINHLNGKKALKLARARNSHGGYGLPRSNFDREINQQRILQAIQKKALKSGILADPDKCLKILDSLGNNIRTNIRTAEIRTAIEVASKMDTKQIVSLPLTGDDANYVTTGMVGAQSVVMPSLGVDNYSAIHTYILEAFEKQDSKKKDSNSDNKSSSEDSTSKKSSSSN